MADSNGSSLRPDAGDKWLEGISLGADAGDEGLEDILDQLQEQEGPNRAVKEPTEIEWTFQATPFPRPDRDLGRRERELIASVGVTGFGAAIGHYLLGNAGMIFGGSAAFVWHHWRFRR